MYTITLTPYSSTYTYAHKYSIHVCGICGAIAMCMNSIYVPLLSHSLPLPISQDDAFEDSVVDFFETADTDRDGVIEYEDLYNVSIIIIIIIDLFHCWLLHVVYVSFLHQLFFLLSSLSGFSCLLFLLILVLLHTYNYWLLLWWPLGCTGVRWNSCWVSTRPTQPAQVAGWDWLSSLQWLVHCYS